jgi:Domain of unknown function (DUF4062)
MDFGKVFISSILNPSVEDLRNERKAAREVVESFGFLKPWAFETSPASTETLDQSYLRHVEECDVFILILGAKVTPPVNAEWLRAKKLKKPTLVFVKSVAQRDAEVDDVLDALNKKYASFKTIEGLKQSVKSALEQTLVIGIRSLSLKSATLSVRETLRELAEHKNPVRVSPLVPAGLGDVFRVMSVDQDILVLQKSTSGQEVDVPLSRVTEVLPPANNDHGTVTILGRLQWTSLANRWKFFPDPLAGAEASLGLGKISSPHDSHAAEIRAILERKNIQSCWDWVFNLGDRIGAGWQVFYDDDGRYMKYPANPSEQIFVIQPR